MMSNTEAKKEQIFQMKSGVCQNQNTGTHVRLHLLVHVCAHGGMHKPVYSHTNRAWVKYKSKALAHGVKHQSQKPIWGRIRSWKTNITPLSTLQLCLHLLMEIHTSPSLNAASAQSQMHFKAGKAGGINLSLIPKAERKTIRRLSAQLSTKLSSSTPGTGRRRWKGQRTTYLATLSLRVKYTSHH